MAESGGIMGARICAACYWGAKDPGCHTKEERAAKKEAVEQGQLCAVCLYELPDAKAGE